MIAGALNETIDLYMPKVIRDEYGNQKTEYVKRLTTRAKVSVNRGTREEQNNEVVVPYLRHFTIRYYVDVGEFDRILYKGKFYSINSIEYDREYQQILLETQQVND